MLPVHTGGYARHGINVSKLQVSLTGITSVTGSAHGIYVVKLQDLAKETEIYIDTNTFLYTLIYHLEEEFYERIIIWPLDVKININN